MVQLLTFLSLALTAEELKQDLEETARFNGGKLEQLIMLFCKQTKLRYNKLTVVGPDCTEVGTAERFGISEGKETEIKALTLSNVI